MYLRQSRNYWQVPDALWIEVTIKSEPLIEEFSVLLPDDEEALGFDDDEELVDVAILPLTRTLCPTQLWSFTFPSGIRV